MQRSPATSSWTPVLIVGWMALVVAGFGMLWVYSHRPGAAGVSPSMLPASAPVATSPGRPTLLLFAHPGCACTQATLGELERLLTDVGPDRAPVIHVLLCRPDQEDDGWTEGPVRSRAERLAEARVSVDAGGALAREFGVTTSGTALLYGCDGDLLFRGGITASRAHEGANTGRTLLTRLLRDQSVTNAATPVYGCPMVGCDVASASGGGR